MLFHFVGPATRRREIREKIANRKSCEKLMLDYEPEKKYRIHYRSLQQCTQLGMQVTKVHRVLSFRHEAWLEPYITASTNMRSKATNDFKGY